MKQYKLYRISLINDIPMLHYVNSVTARNIVEAEFLFEGYIETGIEYMILFSK